mmetsp:Transcript_134027/g.237245  ORF Transcript_134027/g.237245 Transcript_134027/m.237245 type:complete len:336 (-) Transcript_134027:160-1167(-)
MPEYQPENEGTWQTQAFWCSVYGLGITATLLIYGLQQERLMQIPYGGELFTISTFLVFANRLVNLVYGFVMCVARGESLTPQAPLWKYTVVSLTNVYASTFQYEALKYISFTVQMLGKSFKMMPVMMWGIFISQKRYTITDWLVAACVTGGSTLFLVTGPTGSGTDQSSTMYGLFFLCGYLALDGLTSTMQEKLFRQYKVSMYNQILYVNVCSSFVSLVTLVITSDLGPAFAFCNRHSGFVKDLMLLQVSAVGSQWFIYAQIQGFGALVFAATMNIRQIASIAVSYIWYGHQATVLQVTSLVLVCSALCTKSYLGLTAIRGAGESKDLEKGKLTQ